LSARELKTIADIGATLGYSSDELKQFVNDEIMRTDKEKEQQRQHKGAETDRERQEAEDERQREEAEAERQHKENEAENIVKLMKLKDGGNLNLRSLKWNQKQHRKKLKLRQSRKKQS